MKLNYRILSENASTPRLATDQSAGYDLYALEQTIVEPNEIRAIDTGIALEIPNGYFGHIASRSGLIVKHGVITLGNIIDADYRGPIKIILHNCGSKPFTVSTNQAIAQIIIVPVTYFELILQKTEKKK